MLTEKNNLVSIICLCFNHEKYVVEALESAINQTYQNIELIILDDASTDNSCETINNWLQNHPNIKFIQNKSNLGNTKSFNLAAKHAKGEFLIDFATDDILLPNFIETLIEKYKSSELKNIGLIYSNVELINENGSFVNNYFEVDNNNKTLSKRPTGNIFENVIDSGKSICSVSAIFTSNAYNKLNGFDESLAYEDLDFWIRLSRDFEIDFVDEILVKKRVLSNSLGSQFHNKNYSYKINSSTLKILNKAFKLCKSKAEFRNLLKRIHYEIELNLKSKNFMLIAKLLVLKFKISLKLKFS